MKNKNEKDSIISIKDKEYKLFGISIWKIFSYFIIYSILGYIIETIFGIITMGEWQSRQSFLYGPFLGIYGIGAVFILVFSKYFNKNNITLFLGGYIIGTLTEYIFSFLIEVILETDWWDYSGKILNINGRVCLLYSIFWGILTLVLVKIINPFIDKICNKIKEKISKKVLKIIVSVLIIFLFIDCILTIYAQDMFITRMVVEKNIPVYNKEAVNEKYIRVKNNKNLDNFINSVWGNEKMIKTFPNIKIKDKDFNVIYLNSLLPEIKPYYIKIFK